MLINMTVDLGTILQTIVIVGSAAAFIFRMQQKMSVLETEVRSVREQIDRLSEVTIVLAKQDQRLLHMESQVNFMNKYLFEAKAKMTA